MLVATAAVRGMCFPLNSLDRHEMFLRLTTVAGIHYCDGVCSMGTVSATLSMYWGVCGCVVWVGVVCRDRGGWKNSRSCEYVVM